MTASASLTINGVTAGYGVVPVLSDLSADIPGTGVTLVLGHNGAGKSTLAKCIMGTLPLWDGNISFDGREIHRMTPWQRLASGIALILQERAVFAELTVVDNLHFASLCKHDRPRVFRQADIWALFPALADAKEKLAGSLSGGQQRMLAISMGLITSPRLLILDEPSLGLSPKLVSEVMAQVRNLCTNSKVAILLIEQNIDAALSVAQHIIAIRNGRLIFSGGRDTLASPSEVMALL